MKEKLLEKLLTLLLSAGGAGLVVWRNDAVQDARLKALEQAIINLQSTTLEIDKLATELRIAVGVLDERSKGNRPERDFLPILPKPEAP